MREELMRLAEEKYREFHKKLCPGTENILGVRVPNLRKVAKKIAKEDWREVLRNAPEDYYEEVMVKGMVIGYAKMETEERLEWIAWFVPKINNWAVCDGFCGGLKAVAKEPERYLEFLLLYRTEPKEFSQRFFAVMLMDYYTEEAWIDHTIELLDQTKHPGYYTKMGVAWALSVCFVKHPQKTMEYLQSGNTLDDFTYNKTISKICDSYRVEKEVKRKLRSMRRPSTRCEAAKESAPAD